MMTKYRQNYLFLCLFFLSTTLFAQTTDSYEVRGNVKDSVTNETLPFASVFFSGTTFGTTSDENGDFVLKADAPGTYDLVVSFTGFKTFFRQVDLNSPGAVTINVSLSADAKLIGGVTVTAKKDQKWRDNLQVFKRTFLGTSENMYNCRIVNEEVLNFDYDGKTRVFEAWASEPLIIENKALGYKVKYLLENFVIYYQYNFSSFYGFPSFTDMTKGKKTKRKWINARDKAYMGSVEHFMRSLYRGKTYEEGFRINKAKDIEGMGRVFDSNDFPINEIVKPAAVGVRKEFNFEDYLYVTYLNEEPSPKYRSGLRFGKAPEISRGGGQMSWISMAQGAEKVQFEKSGYMINPLAIVLEGYWSFEKVADLLPTNYQPTND